MADFIKAILMPSNIIILCALTGLGLLYFERLRQPAIALLASAGILLTIFSTGTVASLLLSPLEYEFPYIENPGKYPDVKHIVILTAYAEDDSLIPLSSRVSSSGAYRLLEAHRLYLACVECDIYVTGYETATRVMKDLLTSMAIPEERIFEENKSVHTYGSAHNMQTIVQNTPFYLVSSAGHMPRAIRVFRKLGMHPIPAPTDFQLPKNFLDANISPSPQHLYWSDLAVREYGGLVWYKLTGKI